jgi:hypothetical protein
MEGTANGLTVNGAANTKMCSDMWAVRVKQSYDAIEIAEQYKLTTECRHLPYITVHEFVRKTDGEPADGVARKWV